jgi:GT2 family glycosyltransferase
VELRVITREQGGSGAARNTGIAASSAPLVLFTDDDCRPDTAWLLAYARAPWTPETGVMAGRIVSPDQSSRVARYCRRIGYNEFPTGEGPITFANTANCAYPRAVLTAVGGFDERLCGGGTDVDLSHRVAALGYALAYLPEAVVRHYHREDLPSLLRGYRLRGYREGLRRALWSERKRPGPGRLALSAGSLLLRVLRATLLPVDAARMAADGVAWRDALPFAGYDWMRKLARGWGDLQFQLAGLCGREELTPRSAVTAGPPTSTSPADDGRAPLPGKP